MFILPIGHSVRGLALAGLCVMASVPMPPAQLLPPAQLPFDRALVVDFARAGASVCGQRRGGPGPVRALLAAAAVAAPVSQGGPIPLHPDLAAHPFPIASSHPATRQWFSQGLLLAYGFNHAGAVASFRQARQLDPGCAICWWGEAMALGPNINAPMDGRDQAAAIAALDRAMALGPSAPALERALIEALSVRYDREGTGDRAALDAAYADAMLAVASRFPGNDDIAVLAAEAVMNTTPWNYWEPDRRTPVGRSGEAVRLLEAVLARNPDHVQAAHLYIHMMEASDPARAERVADRLARVAPPSAAHLVHMPSHIWIQRGRYRESIAANVKALRADEAYITATGDRGLLRYGYYPHNLHFVVVSAQMAGDMDTVLRESGRLRAILDVETSAKVGWVQLIDAAPFLAMAQYAQPDEILALPPPDSRLPYAGAMRHYARAVAHAARRDRAGFEAEMAALAASAGHPAMSDLVDQAIPVPDIIALARAMALGRWAIAQGHHRDAVAHFADAARIEGRLGYFEPPLWHHPVRQSLGAALYLAGDPEAASEAFRAALVQAPASGWALFGLAVSEAAAGRPAAAAAARAAFARAWAGDSRWLRMERL